MICRNCGYGYDGRTVGFQKLCENCGEYLHTCVNCNIYDSNAKRCRSFTTEAVGDRKDKNYCEEFVPSTDTVQRTDSAEDKSADDFKDLFSMDGA